MSNTNKFETLEEIHTHLSTAEGDNIKETVQMIPLLSYISCIDLDDDFYQGILISIHKTYFKIITNLNDIDSIIKIKYSKINKIYYVYNSRTYRRVYTNQNRDKKKNAIEDIILIKKNVY